MVGSIPLHNDVAIIVLEAGSAQALPKLIAEYRTEFNRTGGLVEDFIRHVDPLYDLGIANVAIGVGRLAAASLGIVQTQQVKSGGDAAGPSRSGLLNRIEFVRMIGMGTGAPHRVRLVKTVIRPRG